LVNAVFPSSDRPRHLDIICGSSSSRAGSAKCVCVLLFQKLALRLSSSSIFYPCSSTQHQKDAFSLHFPPRIPLLLFCNVSNQPILIYLQYIYLIIAVYLLKCTALQVGRSRVRFPMVSLEFFIDKILPAALWP
jgi:hypothetical protein